MSIFYQEEPSNPSKRCKCIASALRDVFSKCHSFRDKLTGSTLESDEPLSNFDDEEEIFVSAIITKYMESKSKRKSSIAIDSFNWALSPGAGDSAATRGQSVKRHGDEDGDEFWSAGSQLSRCSSDTSFDAFVSAKACLSKCSSLNRIDNFRGFDGNRRSIILEFINCEGWPFGLCRKALLLPPLPKSPADSWSWRKSGRMIRIHG